MSRRVEWTDRARKDLKRLDRRTRERIVAAVDEFARTGRGDVRRLQSAKDEVYRLRVGDWRIFFTPEGEILILILRVRPRGGAY